MFTLNYRAFLLTVIYLLTGVALLTGIDYLVGSSIENVRTVRLKKYSEAGMDAVVREVGLLELEVDRINERVSQSLARTYPSLADIKEMSQSFGLRFERMERVSQPSVSASGLRRYNTTIHGDARKLVRFLRRLETTYVISCEQLLMYPADESGGVVGLSMAILIDESGT